MDYLCLGAEDLYYEKFKKINDNNASSKFKPSGGLWLTEYFQKDLMH